MMVERKLRNARRSTDAYVWNRVFSGSNHLFTVLMKILSSRSSVICHQQQLIGAIPYLFGSPRTQETETIGIRRGQCVIVVAVCTERSAESTPDFRSSLDSVRPWAVRAARHASTPHEFSAAPRSLAGSPGATPNNPTLPSEPQATPYKTGSSAPRYPPAPRFLPRGSLRPILAPTLQATAPLPPLLFTNPRHPDQITAAALSVAVVGGYGERRSEKERARAASARRHPSRKKGAPASGGGGLERDMLLMAAPGGEQHKRRRGRPLAADLLQNCDLPPPAKLFGPFPALQRLENTAAPDQKGEGDGGNDSLLRALRLSQSRAREAEEKLAVAGASNGNLAALLVRDSVALSAHRRWVMMLEAENSVLRAGGGGAAGTEPEEEDGAGAAARDHGVAAAWWVALAVCVGIAGVGLALGKLLL